MALFQMSNREWPETEALSSTFSSFSMSQEANKTIFKEKRLSAEGHEAKFIGILI